MTRCTGARWSLFFVSAFNVVVIESASCPAATSFSSTLALDVSSGDNRWSVETNTSPFTFMSPNHTLAITAQAISFSSQHYPVLRLMLEEGPTTEVSTSILPLGELSHMKLMCL